MIVKLNEINFHELPVGTIFTWHVKEASDNSLAEQFTLLGQFLGMKISDVDGNNEQVLCLNDEIGICYSWDDRYHIDRIINNVELIEKED